MKYRRDFVTNSSSSGFVVSTKGLSDEKIKQILNYEETAANLGMIFSDGWDVWRQKGYKGQPDSIIGFTVCCNGDMPKLFQKLGIDVEFDDDEY